MDPQMAAPNDTTNHPDPNGDVVLVVSPPAQPRAYNRYENTQSNSHDSALGGLYSFLSDLPQDSGPGQQSNSPNKQENQENQPPATQRFKVSSKHLTLSSKYFEGRLRSCWSEGETLRSKGDVELDITDTDPEAFLILLNIIHGHTRRVPRLVMLKQLTELAVLVDYFQCHEIVELFSNLWVDALRLQVPSERTNNVVRWIFISWVFRDAAIFKKVTRTAQRTAVAEMGTLELPIPSALKKRIDKSRTDALEAVLSGLSSRAERLKGTDIFRPNYVCNFYCDSMQLGALLQQMKAKGLEPCPRSPFSRLSFDRVTKSISEFYSPKCVSYSAFLDSNYSTVQVQHVIIGQDAQDEVNRRSQSLEGFDLLEYP